MKSRTCAWSQRACPQITEHRKRRTVNYTVEKPAAPWVDDRNNIANKGQTDIVCHQLGFSEEDKSLMSYELGTHNLNLITRDHQTNPK